MTNLTIEDFRKSTLDEYKLMRENLRAIWTQLDDLNTNMADNILKEIDALIEKDELAFVDGRISAMYDLVLSSLDE